MDYIGLTIRLEPCEEWFRDLIADALGAIGFEAFEETEQGLKAYIDKNNYDNGLATETLKELKEYGQITVRREEIPFRNWNERWENEVRESVSVGDCFIHASNEPKSDKPFDIVIDPEQSFGTASHPTTQMLLQTLTSAPLNGKTMLDVGTGTGILAIASKMNGAKEVTGVDIDEHAVVNAQKNFSLNAVEGILRPGSIEVVKGKNYDIVVANINRNIVVNMLPQLSAATSQGGCLLTSGFLAEDQEAVTIAALSVGFTLEQSEERDGWLMLRLRKQ